MTGAHGKPPENLLWRTRVAAGGRQRELRCTFEQLGEACYELRVSFGGNAVVSETFSNTEDLLAKAEELRMALAPEHRRRRSAPARAGGPLIRH